MSLPQGFDKYIAPDADRLKFLQDYLLARSVQTSVVSVAGRKHLYVNFPSSSYNPRFKIKTILTHYDRVSGSPGANDNSAADFQIADFAVRLKKAIDRGAVPNIRIFFTDGEELGEGGVSSQGAFGLAELFKKLGITNDDVYVFDSCGRGQVAVLAQAGLGQAQSKNSSFAKKFISLFERTQNLLRTSCQNSWITLPVPYSDNAGFLALGIPAVAITLLPKEEVSDYQRALLSDKNLESEVMNCHMDDGPDKLPRFKYEEKMPVTWRLFHTPYDNALSLTEESFDVMRKILDTLAASRTLS
ncbi:MAG: M28 family peptidase [Treponema sp.]|nr:M28 family peptidase [Treponema sp.]